jgi:hypothetical protein
MIADDRRRDSAASCLSRLYLCADAQSVEIRPHLGGSPGVLRFKAARSTSRA